jgi:hypothetical protein
VLQETLDLSGFFGLEVSMLASRTQVRGFEPDRKPSNFSGEKILSLPSYGGEVKDVCSILQL